MNKQKKYKIDTAKYKEILAIAAKLPELQKSHPISGKPMYRADVEFKGTKNFTTRGTPYQNSFVRKQQPILVNHSHKLMEAYEANGQAGIDDYLGYVDYIVSRDKPVKAEENEHAR